MARGRPAQPKGPRFTEATEETRKLMAHLIEKYHDHLAEIGSNITLWMVNGRWYKKGKAIDGDVQLVSGLNRKESDTIYRILLNATTWNNADAKRRAYIMDTQLRRCCQAESGKDSASWIIEDYEVKTFPDIVARYGLMSPEMQQLDKAMHQLKLAFDEKAA